MHHLASCATASMTFERLRRRCARVGLVLLVALACRDASGPRQAALRPLTPLELAIVQRYQEVFGESVPRPAVFVPVLNPGAPPCEWHVTSTAWLKESATGWRLLTLYTSADGSAVQLQTVLTPLKPAGTFRVLVAVMNFPESLGPGGMALWEAAQASINADLAGFAALKGYDKPLVVFENTNVLIDPPLLVDRRSAAAVTAALAARGHVASNYDVVVSIDIDPATPDGGFAQLGARFIHMGNFGFGGFPLSASAYVSIARAVYGHEFAHLWGWPGTHDWAKCHVAGLNPFGFNFWVPPVLLGWEDVDGDGVPEVLDATPYGRPGA